MAAAAGPAKKPGLKERPSRHAPKIALERALGLTSQHGRALSASDALGGTLAFAAGRVVVMYDAKKNTQRFVHATGPVSSVCFSADGTLIAAGQTGSPAYVEVWRVSDGQLVHRLAEHSFGVAVVAFHPLDSSLLLTVGFRNDQRIHVWRLDPLSAPAPSSGEILSTATVSRQVYSASWEPAGRWFVTAGDRHIKFWEPPPPPPLPSSSGSELGGAAPATIPSRPAVMLEQHHSATFVDVVVCRVASASERISHAAAVRAGADPGDIPLESPRRGASVTLAVTAGGMLTAFDSTRLMDRWVPLRADSAFSVTAAGSVAYVGCSDGTVRAFAVPSLEHLGTLPRAPVVGALPFAGALAPDSASPGAQASVRPGAVAVRASHKGGRVAVIYGDRSLALWAVPSEAPRPANGRPPVLNPRGARRLRSFLHHCGAVRDVAVVEDAAVAMAAVPSAGADGAARRLTHADAPRVPPGSFVTASADGTVRLWNINPAVLPPSKRPATAPTAAVAALRGGLGSGKGTPNPSPGASPFAAVAAAALMRPTTAAPGTRDPAGTPSTPLPPHPGADEAGCVPARHPLGYETLAVLSLDGSDGDGRWSPPPRGSASARAVASATFDPERGWRAPASADINSPLCVAVRQGEVPVGGRPSADAPPHRDAIAAIGTSSGEVVLVSLGTLRVVGRARPHTKDVLSVAFSPATGAALASASKDHTACVMDARTAPALPYAPRTHHLRECARLSHHSAAVTSLTFSYDDCKLVTTGADGGVGFCKVTIAGRAPVDLVAVSTSAAAPPPAGMTGDALPPAMALARAAAAAAQHAACTGSVAAKLWRSASQPYGSVLSSAMDATNRHAATVGTDKALHVWALRSGRHLRSHKVAGSEGKPASGLARVAMDPSGLFAAVASQDCGVTLVDFYGGRALARVQGHADVVTGLTFTPDCKRLITVSADGVVLVWRLGAAVTASVRERIAEITQARSAALSGRAMRASQALLASQKGSADQGGPAAAVGSAVAKRPPEAPAAALASAIAANPAEPHPESPPPPQPADPPAHGSPARVPPPTLPDAALAGAGASGMDRGPSSLPSWARRTGGAADAADPRSASSAGVMAMFHLGDDDDADASGASSPASSAPDATGRQLGVGALAAALAGGGSPARSAGPLSGRPGFGADGSLPKDAPPMRPATSAPVGSRRASNADSAEAASDAEDTYGDDFEMEDAGSSDPSRPMVDSAPYLADLPNLDDSEPGESESSPSTPGSALGPPDAFAITITPRKEALPLEAPSSIAAAGAAATLEDDGSPAPPAPAAPEDRMAESSLGESAASAGALVLEGLDRGGQAGPPGLRAYRVPTAGSRAGSRPGTASSAARSSVDAPSVRDAVANMRAGLRQLGIALDATPKVPLGAADDLTVSPSEPVELAAEGARASGSRGGVCSRPSVHDRALQYLTGQSALPTGPEPAASSEAPESEAGAAAEAEGHSDPAAVRTPPRGLAGTSPARIGAEAAGAPLASVSPRLERSLGASQAAGEGGGPSAAAVVQATSALESTTLAATSLAEQLAGEAGESSGAMARLLRQAMAQSVKQLTSAMALLRADGEEDLGEATAAAAGEAGPAAAGSVSPLSLDHPGVTALLESYSQLLVERVSAKLQS
ncbi:hypothetical protein FNF31_01362 [Cafeteria roenbergensis]|nr:hypothetical protein FNF31_01362 [Cafeteria roenbergensis]